MADNRDKQKLSEKVKKEMNYREEDRTPLDQYKDQQFADDIPLEDLKIEAEQEKDKRKTQDSSQSEAKYEADFEEEENR